jgi:transcriptional regulator with XRE-family HTH domain
MNYNRIKEWLAIKQKTAKDLAKYVNVSPQTASFWNRNVKQPAIPTLYKIADFLEIEPSDLLTKKADIKQTKSKGVSSKKAAPKVQVKISRSKKKG